MTAIEAVATYLPPRQVRVADLADELSLSPIQVAMFERFHKLTAVRRDDGSLLDLLRAAVDRLEALRGNEHRVRFVLHARAFPVVVPYPVNPLHQLCAERGLRHAEAFTVTQQSCATGLLAVDLAGRLLAECGEPDALALVLAGEKAFTRDSRMLDGTSIFSEGSAACLISLDGPRDRLLAYASLERGDFDGEPEDVAPLFQRGYTPSMAAAIEAALDDAGVELGELSVILPHNVNLGSWRRVAKALEVPPEQVLIDNVLTTGHMFCADMFVNYATARERGRLRPGERYLVAAAGAGLGATFSAMVLEH
ncbi:3-oxoacyl-ACP synthase [Dactylosporangium vinaceum]|uniref:3-oxoacyl-[acyl-carrier-protein] synthase III C-terminal domain-containing protein n=1 Tax=Dactylosporangium vinaceum TaxID=53362 RepID=A0ABV5ML03_9ACTN|nr:3-oxoacyl-[acyl-carrier-protein] synthase III C-terminal domain-containing protein [Dactylosporangium vinaceum]UAB94003.1 3-oxoacyl-ACP synthase [Dactylosporangium vinaceum]